MRAGSHGPRDGVVGSRHRPLTADTLCRLHRVLVPPPEGAGFVSPPGFVSPGDHTRRESAEARIVPGPSGPEARLTRT